MKFLSYIQLNLFMYAKDARDGCDLENFTGGKYLYLVFIGSYIAACSGWHLLVHCCFHS
jgi:hypothetical protein